MTDQQTYKNAAAVARYLDQAGYAVTDDTVRNHVKAGKLGPGPGGHYLQKTVDEYARLHLKLKATGDVPKKAQEKLLARKLQASVESEELKAQLARIELEKEQGKLVEIETFLPKLQSAIAACRTRLLQIPNKPTLGLDLEQRKRLDDAIRDCLGTISDYAKLVTSEETEETHVSGLFTAQ